MRTNIVAELKRERDCDVRAGLDLPGVCECEVRNESDSILGGVMGFYGGTLGSGAKEKVTQRRGCSLATREQHRIGVISRF